MKLSKLINSLPGMVFQLRLISNDVIKFDYCSIASQLLYGVSPKEIVENDKKIFEIFSNEQTISLKESLIFCSEEMIDWQITIEVNIKGDKRHHQFYGTPEKLDNGDILWRGIINDVSDQHIERDSHIKNEILLSSLFDLSPLGIALIDLDTRDFIKTNNAFQRILTYSDSQLKRLTLDDIIIEKDIHELSRQWFVLQHQSYFEPHEVCYKNSKNESIDVLVNGMLVKNNTDKAMLWVIIEDISARKAIERQLIEEKIHAEDAAAAKSMFLAGMGHEIRTPLNGVLGMLDILSHGKITDEQKRQINIAQDSGNILLRLLDDILDFSKINAGKLQLEAKSVNIETTLLEIIKPYVYLANNKRVNFEFNYDTDTCNWVMIDELRLKQIINNLLSNAIKFTAKGTITLHCKLQLQQDNRILTLAVEDTGIGLTDQQCEVLFQPFSQADSSTTRQYGGTGLGLAICYELCKAMQGGISVNSKLNQGSVFEVWLCVEPGIPLNVESTLEDKTTTWPKNCQVLLVDDNDINCEVIRLMLKNSGLTVTVAKNGQQALDLLSENTFRNFFSVILMDCMMPVMDGYQASIAIRQGKVGVFNSLLPIIALTANALPGDKERCLAAGMNSYLSKPVNQLGLNNAIADALNEKNKNETIDISASNNSNQTSETIDTELLWDKKSFSASLGDIQEVEKHLAVAFLDSLKKMMDDISEAVIEKNIEKIASLSHSLKGSSGQMCCYPLAEAAKIINDAAKNNNWKTISKNIDHFNMILHSTSNLVSAHIES